MSSPTPPLPQEFLDQLRSLTEAVKKGAADLSRFDQRSLDADSVQASDALDYVAIRELLGRPARTETTSRFIQASRKVNQLDLFDVPTDGTDVAVFTGPGLPAEVLPLGTAVTPPPPDHYRVRLNAVQPAMPITRIEIRRSDGIPIRLGPRLEAG